MKCFINLGLGWHHLSHGKIYPIHNRRVYDDVGNPVLLDQMLLVNGEYYVCDSALLPEVEK